jgi:hypothetical protein
MIFDQSVIIRGTNHAGSARAILSTLAVCFSIATDSSSIITSPSSFV